MSSEPKFKPTDIAIIGMACRFPGANNYDTFWDNLEKGVSSIKEVPPERWEAARYYSSDPEKPNKSVSKWYGLIEAVERFDNRFFNIPPGEARYMDPQQRLLLEEAWHCIEDSGVALNELREKRTDVYVGTADWDYILNALSSDINVHTVLGNHSSLLANRISYVLGLRGASLTLDTACSSSLFAAGKACESLASLSAEYALVGSACVHSHPLKYIAFSKAHIASPDGRCKTFDKDANGFVLGDGVGVLLLQRLEDAVRGKKHIYGIIKGGATNHGGSGVTITSPRVAAQAEVLRDAYEKTGIGPESINYIEAHGTGTLIGDPIEVEALTTVFRQHTDEKQWCTIGSVKANIGHTGGSAGMAAMIKVLMMMRAGKIPPNLNFNTPNPVIDFDNSPFRVATELSPWTRVEPHTTNGHAGRFDPTHLETPKNGKVKDLDIKKRPLRAGVSAFGFGGANAHLILEAPPSIPAPEKIPGAKKRDGDLFVLSAKSEESLMALLERWKAFSRSDRFKHLAVGDICKTLATGRESFPYRLGGFVESHDELLGFLDGAPTVFSERETPSLCLRIGQWDWNGWEDLVPLLKEITPFEREIEKMAAALEKTDTSKATLRGLRRKKWPANHELYRFMAGVALIKSFLDTSGIVPKLLAGETKNSGFLTALVLSGSLSVEDALTLLLDDGHVKPPDTTKNENLKISKGLDFKVNSHIKTSDTIKSEKLRTSKDGEAQAHIVLRRPDIAFFDPVGQQPIPPLRFDAEYLQNLTRRLSITDDAAASYLTKAKSMLDNQFTFKGYVAKWDAVLKTKGSSIRQIIDDETRFADEKRIFSVIIANCIRKLNRKWDLSETPVAASAEFFEMVDLIADNVMPKEMAVALLQDELPDFEAAADILNNGHVRPADTKYESVDRAKAIKGLQIKNQKDLHGGTHYPILKQQPLTEIKDAAEWLKKFENTVIYEPGDMLCLDFGRLSGGGLNKDSVVVDMGDTPAAIVGKAMLKLWLKGVDTDFSALYPDGSFQKVPLPVYPFNGQPYWLPKANGAEVPGLSRVESKLHPLLHRNTSDFLEQRFSATFTGDEFFLADHRVERRKVLPGVAHMEMARCALELASVVPEDDRTAVVLKNVVWVRPIVSTHSPVHVNIGLFHLENGEIGYEIYDGAGADFDRKRSSVELFSQGIALLKRAEVAPVSDIEALKAKCSRAVISAAEHYGRLKAAGLDLGQSFQGIETLYVGEDCALAHLTLPLAAEPTMEGFGLHPGLLDSALQAASCLFDGSEAFELAIPFTLKTIEIFNDTTSPMWSFAKKSKGNASQDQNGMGNLGKNQVEHGVKKFNVELYDGSGNLCVRILEISFKEPKFGGDTVKIESETAMGSLMLRPLWREERADGQRHAFEYHRHRVLVYGGDAVPETALQGRLKGAEVQALFSDGKSIDGCFQDIAIQAFEAIQAEMRSALEDPLAQSGGKTLLQILIPGGSEEETPWLYGFSGLLKTVRLENPGWICQLIETDLTTGDLETIGEKLAETGACPDDSVIRYKDGKRFVERIEEALPESPDFSWNERCVCLITGGLGGLGLIFSQEILEKVEEATLILTGRSKLDAAGQAAIDRLKKTGAKVEYRQVDMGKKDEVVSLIDHIGKTHGSLTGVIHSAGVVSDNFIIKKSADEFETVMAPKVRGLVNLDTAIKEHPLDFFIIFSSMAGSFGNIGQADYACANAFAGGYAAYRNRLVKESRRQGRTVSIHWPLWKEGGMKVGAETEEMMWQKMGMVAMGTKTGIEGFYRSMATEHPHIMFVEGDIPTIRQKLIWATLFSEPKPHGAAPGDLSIPAADLLTEGTEGGEGSAGSAVPTTVSGVDGERNALRDHVRLLLIHEVSQLMGIPKASIDGRAALEKYGFDSITLTEFTNKLNTDYGLELAPTLFFEYPDVESLSVYLATEHRAAFAGRLAESASSEGAVPAPVRQVGDTSPLVKRVRSRFLPARFGQKQATAAVEPVAIVGMSGRFPMAEDIEAFWENLAQGKHCITEIPRDRWDWKALYGDAINEGNQTAIKWGGFIDDVETFDPSFFEISPREAELMDPQQRLMMLYAWKAIEDAGIPPGSLAGTKTGIFVGTGGNQYAEMIAKANIPVESYTATGSVPSVGPNRMSYFLDIHGPSEPVETSCSSSLIAIHRAVEAMANGSCDMAIVGGVNTIITPGFHLSFGNAGMLSRDGKCKTFSDQADGYVRGEAVGMLFLKKLRDARQSGDHIYGVIRGTAVNHGGRSSSLTAPNPKAQAEVLKQAYQTAGIDPRTVGYIEAHGTGTSLGDPIEIDALKAAFKALYSETGTSDGVEPHCGLGSVKSNIGHTELAAGVSGIIKVLLQIKHKTIAQSLHCGTVNPYIRLDDSPFYIAREARKWTAPLDREGHALPRRAGVSSFGFGGANAHVVIEEYIDEAAHDFIGAQVVGGKVGGGQTQAAPQSHVQGGGGGETETVPGIGGSYLFVLSAKNEARLKDYARAMADYLTRTEKRDSDLANIAYMTQTGRDAMDERLGLIIGSVSDLLEKLNRFIAGDENIEGLYRGSVRENTDAMGVFQADDELLEAVDKWIARGKYSKLISFWVRGLVFDWNRLYGDIRPKRISLPTYPFARERYWIDGAAWQMDPSAGIMEYTRFGDTMGSHGTGYGDIPDSDTFDPWDAPLMGDQIGTESAGIGTLMFKRSWREKRVDVKNDAEKDRLEYEKYVVALYGGGNPKTMASLSKKIRAAVADAEIINLKSGAKAIHEVFSQCALSLFEKIRAALKAKLKDRVLFQVVVLLGKDSAIGHGSPFGAANRENPKNRKGGDSHINGSGLFSGLSGLLKTAHIENPAFIGQLIEIDTTDGIDTLLDENIRHLDGIASLLKENMSYPEDNHIRYCDGKRLVSSFDEIDGIPEAPAVPWKDGGVYLITGGIGGLGLIFAEEIALMVKTPVVILAGRTAPDAEKEKRLDGLRQQGARVEFRPLDVARKTDVDQLIKGIISDFGGLSAILHSAGVIKDNFILNKTPKEFKTVLAPKVAGITALDEASRDLNLDFFAVFSSGAGAVGNTGQSDYACANAFMDAYAIYRDGLVKAGERKGKTLSINWPPWKSGGMAIDTVTKKMVAQGSGMVAMETDVGIRTFYQALNLAQVVVMPLWGDLAALRRYMIGVQSDEIRQRLHGWDGQIHPVGAPERLVETTERGLKRLLADATKIPIADIGPDDPFENFGIDSLMISKLNQRLEGIFAEVPKTLFYEHRTLRALARYFIEAYPHECMRLAGFDLDPLKDEPINGGPVRKKTIKVTPSGFYGAQSHGSHPPVPALPGMLRPGTGRRMIGNAGVPVGGGWEPIAVIGMSGRYPLADNLGAYWENLKGGKNCIREIPEGRWPLNGFFHPDPDIAVAQGKSYCKWGGFIDGFADFDPLFFNISPKDGMNMDPQERLFIMACWELFEDAGYTQTRLKSVCDGRVGVFAGITKTGYELYGPALWRQGDTTHPNTSFGSLANRISYLFDLKGPSIPIDTMCSSSLTAIHEACEHLYRNECDMAVAGGVNLYLHPSTYSQLCALRMLTADNKNRSFGQGGDGFLPGEGVGAVLLKPLGKALADGDPIHALIRGTGVNHGGRTSGYTIPNPVAQADLIRLVMEKAGVKAREISYVEAHGTGTELGDPIEISGLTQAFGVDTDVTLSCAIGSAKSNIGHLEAAAGIAGLTKIVLQMQNRQIAPSLHAKNLNPNIDFHKTPFAVQQELGAWQQPEIDGKMCPRIASLSSFGAGGANAHIIVQEFSNTAHVSASDPTKYENDGTCSGRDFHVKKADDETGKRQHADDCATVPAIFVLSARNEERLKAYASRMEKWMEKELDARPDLADIAYTSQTGREPMKVRIAMIVGSVAEIQEKLKRYIAGEDNIADFYQGSVKGHSDTVAIFQADEDLQAAIHAWVAKGKYASLLDFWVKGLPLDWNLLYERNATPKRISLPTYPFAKERFWPIDEKIMAQAGRDTIQVSGAIHGERCGDAIHLESSRQIPLTDDQVAESGQRSGKIYEERLRQEASTDLMAREEFLSQAPLDNNSASIAHLEHDVKQHIGTLLAIPTDQLDSDVNLSEFGFDSITLTEFGARLSDFYGVEITPAIFFEHNTIEKLVDYFINNHDAAVKGVYGDSNDGNRLTAASRSGIPSDISSGSMSTSLLSGRFHPGAAEMSAHFQKKAKDMAEWLKRYPECVPLNHGHGSASDTTNHESDNGAVAPDRFQINIHGERTTTGNEGLDMSWADNRFEINLPLNGGKDQKPCFWIHPLTGSVEPYVKIARNMARDQPFFGIRSKGFGTERPFLDNIPEMARYYIEIISALDPEGPYQLAGFSMGGVIAQEMTRLLQERGKSVRNLFLLEPPFPSPSGVLLSGETSSSAAADQSLDEIAMDPETIVTTSNFFIYSHLKTGFDPDGFRAGEAAESDFEQLIKPDGAQLNGDALIAYLASCCRAYGVRQPVEWIGHTIKNMCYAFAYNKKALATHTVLPLPSPGDVAIYYFTQSAQNAGKKDFRNINFEKSDNPKEGSTKIEDSHHRQVLHQGTQKLLGDELTHDEHHYLKWKAMLPGLHTVRVPSSSHFDFLSDRKGLEAIIEACRSIYMSPLNQGDTISDGQMDRKYAVRNMDYNRQKPAVAIVGMSGRFPMAKDLDEFWHRLVEGRDCITEIPKERWDWKAFYGDPLKAGNKTDVKWGGFMESVGDFDPTFFGIAPREAEWMDPQQRLLMLYVWRAIEDAGYAVAGLAGSRTGLFIGTGDSGYGNRIFSGGLDLEGYYGTATLPAMGPNRMSYFLDFHGPSEPVDTTCSSSLVALCKAVEAIESGTCESAIAGGVNLIIDPAFHISLDRLGMLSKEGRCRTFSDRADGYVRGEGVGMLFLKSLDAAKAAGDHIYGVVRGCAVNHGGRANSLTAPNPKAQVAVLREAYEKAGIDPATVGYIETHGTGTVLGDPIEIDALKSAFKGLRRGYGAPALPKPHCGLGSVKTNIGHLELAAGVAGVIKVLLQLKHQTIVKSLHCDRLNPHIKLGGSPFYIATVSQAWEPPRARCPRRAGVSAFGAGGVNAHVVIEEFMGREEYLEKEGGISKEAYWGGKEYLDEKVYRGKLHQTVDGSFGEIKAALPAIFVLSARDEVRLKKYALTMADFFHSRLENKDIPDLFDVAFTSQVGRDAMDERLALIVSSVAELWDKLQTFGADRSAVEGIFRGNVKRDKETLALFTSDEAFGNLIDKWLWRGDYGKLLSLWVKGLDLNWHKLYRDQEPMRRLSLPTYPFDDKYYWIDRIAGGGAFDAGMDGEPLKETQSDSMHYGSQNAMPYAPQENRDSESKEATHRRSQHSDAKPVVSSSSEAPTALMTFEEYLEEQVIETQPGIHIKTLLCFLNEANSGKHVAETLTTLSPETEVIFISGDDEYNKVSRNHYQIDRRKGNSYPMAIADIVREHGGIDAVIYMTPFEGRSAADVDVDILQILQAMAAAKISTPVPFLLAAQLPEGIPSCYGEAWVGFERSLPMVMPKVRFGVIYKAIQGGDSIGGAGADTIEAMAAIKTAKTAEGTETVESNAINEASEIAEAAETIETTRISETRADISSWFKILWQTIHAQKIESAVHVGDKRYVYRNRETTPETTEGFESLIQPGKTYLITGGCGGLGGLLARYLAKRYGVYLILTGRSPMDERIEKLLGEIQDENRDAKAVYVQADICDAGAMKRGLSDVRENFGNVSGVIHGAGIQSEGQIFRKDADGFKKVLRPKIEGTLALDEAMKDEPLDFVCYFSSASAILGDFGACDYAMANRFMAAFARYKNRVQTHVKHIAIHWPLWREGGMGFDFDGGAEIYLKSSGQRLLETTEGFDLFDDLLTRDETRHLVLAGEPKRIRRFLGLQTNKSEVTDSLLLSSAMERGAGREVTGQEIKERCSKEKPVLETPLTSTGSGGRLSTNSAALFERPTPTGRGRRNEMKGFSVAQCLEYDLKTHIGSLLGVDSNQLDGDANLADFGFDSILFAKFAAALTDFYDTEITPSIFFGNPTIERLVHYFLQEYEGMVSSFYAENDSRADQAADADAHSGADQVACSEVDKIADQEVDAELTKNLGQTADTEADRPTDQAVSAEAKAHRCADESSTEASPQKRTARGRVSLVRGNSASPPATLEETVSDAIAIIGMSGRFPDSRSVDDLWEILQTGKEAVSEIPLERFDWRKYYGNEKQASGPEMVSNRCGILPGVAEFDAPFFEISPKEAGWMDPRQRLLLQESWKALEDAGYGPSHIQKNRMGMFVGLESGDYRTLSGCEKGITSDHEGVSAVRLAYFLNFSGPAMAINTACSSGLVAAHQACLSLRAGECDTAIASGMNLLLTPEAFISLGKSGMISSSGRCHAFDKRADGMVPGEAVVSVVLKRLTDAERDNDPIYAVIRGSGINYDGKTNGITAPNQNAQAELLKMVYDRYRINPEEIGHIVTHGTGTKLGDSIEINALVEAFKGYTHKQRFCALTTTKGNFGHSFAASGLVSLVALVQALRHETIPESINFSQENDHIKWRESPFYVNDAAKPWNPGRGNRRLGAISAFGMSGTNAHMVLESYAGRVTAEDVPVDPCYLLVFSAKQKAVLEDKIKDMARFINSFQINELKTTDLAEICLTLSEGRHHFMYRTAVVVQDVEDAIHVLNQIINHQKSPKIFHGEVPRGFTGQKAIRAYAQDMLTRAPGKRGEKEAYRDLLYGLAELYCQGYDIELGRLVKSGKRFGLRLPTYPFARERHWVTKSRAPKVADHRNNGHVRPPDTTKNERTRTTDSELFHINAHGLPPTTNNENLDMPLAINSFQIKISDPGDVPIISGKTGRITLAPLSSERLFPNGKETKPRRLITLSDTAMALPGMRNPDLSPSDKEISPVLPVSSKPSASPVSLTGLGTPDAVSNRPLQKIVLDMPGAKPSDMEALKRGDEQKVKPDDAPYGASVDQSDEAADPNPSEDVLLPKPVLKRLRASLAEALYMEEHDIDPEMPFTEMGMDSIIGVEWIKAVNDLFDMSLEAIKIYDHPNLREFAGFLAKKIDGNTDRVSGDNGTNVNLEHSTGNTGHPHAAGSVSDTKTAATPVSTEATHSHRPRSHSFSEPMIKRLKRSLAEALYMEERDIDPEMPFTEMGMDSIIGVEWIKAVNDAFGMSLEAIKIYDYPNLREFGAFLVEKIGVNADTKTEKPPASPASPTSLEELLQQVQQGILDVDQADQLLQTLQNG